LDPIEIGVKEIYIPIINWFFIPVFIHSEIQNSNKYPILAFNSIKKKLIRFLSQTLTSIGKNWFLNLINQIFFFDRPHGLFQIFIL
jgi:hypothetical protein